MEQEILVFNPQPLGKIDPENLKHALLKVNFVTLCRQYGLTSTLIDSVKENLEVVVSKNQDFPYFLVKYGKDNKRPLFVYERQLKSRKGKGVYQGLHDDSKVVDMHLNKPNFLVEIELGQKQLSDMGLLLAYEIARWAAVKGGGIVLGLDGRWYFLNQHEAFLLLE